MTQRMILDAVELRQFFSKNRYGINEILQIYVHTPVSDHLKQGVRFKRKRRTAKNCQIGKPCNMGK